MKNMSEELAIKVIEAINDRDRELIEPLTTEDIQLRLPIGEVYYGRAGIRGFFDQLEKMLPDLTLAARKVYTCEHFAIVEYEAAGHSPKLAPKEESMGVLILELDGNGRKKVARAQLYLDTAHWQTLTGG